jgi:hypothetical protein
MVFPKTLPHKVVLNYQCGAAENLFVAKGGEFVLNSKDSIFPEKTFPRRNGEHSLVCLVRALESLR